MGGDDAVEEMPRPLLSRPFAGGARRGGARRHDEDGADAPEVDEDQAAKFDEMLRGVRREQKIQSKRAARAVRRGAGEDDDDDDDDDGDDDDDEAPRGGEDDVDDDAEGDGDEDAKEARVWATIKAEREGKAAARGRSTGRVLDADALRSQAEELHQPDFAESLTVVVPAAEGGALHVEELDDDAQRELAFVKLAIQAVKVARKRLDEMGVPHVRPNDFMATMLKSDEHMARVKRRLLKEQKAMQVVEMRKESKRYKLRAKEIEKQRREGKAAKKRGASQLANEFRNKSGADSARDSRMHLAEHEGVDLARERKRARPSSGGGAKRSPFVGKRGSAAPRRGANRPNKAKRAGAKGGRGGSR